MEVLEKFKNVKNQKTCRKALAESKWNLLTTNRIKVRVMNDGTINLHILTRFRNDFASDLRNKQLIICPAGGGNVWWPLLFFGRKNGQFHFSINFAKVLTHNNTQQQQQQSIFWLQTNWKNIFLIVITCTHQGPKCKSTKTIICWIILSFVNRVSWFQLQLHLLIQNSCLMSYLTLNVSENDNWRLE